MDTNRDNVYEVTVRASDGTLYADRMVRVIVLPNNESPMILRAGTGTGTIKYAENGTDPVVTLTATDPEMGTVTWGLSGTDAVDFAIEDGVLTFAVGSADTPPDFENGQGSGTGNNTYVVMVTATDTATTPNVAEFTVTVEVTDEPEDGKVTWAVDADGGTDANDDVMVMQFQVGAILTASVTDGDVSANLNTDARWQWNRSSSRTSTGTPIDGATGNEYTVKTDDVGKFLRVTAYYTEATDQAEQKSAYLVSDYQVLAAPGADNPAPEFDPASVTREVNEGDEGMAVGTRVTATGGHGVLNYTLAGAGVDNAKFEIDQKTGQITTAVVLNYDTDTDTANDCGNDNICTVTVLATDSAGRTSADPVTVMITLMDVDEPPTFVNDGNETPSVVENTEEVTTSTGNDGYEATDPEEGLVTLSLMGADKDLFRLTSDNDLSFRTAPDYENPMDTNKDNVYEVTVRASEGARRADRMVRVSVLPFNEAPVISAGASITGDSSISYEENSLDEVETYEVVGLEDGATVVWSLSGDDAEDLSISSGGVLTFESLPRLRGPGRRQHR